MLKIPDEKVLKTDEEIEQLYKKCKYLYLIGSYAKMTDDAGCLCRNIGSVDFDYLWR